MNKFYFLLCAAAALPVAATEDAMNKALASWQERLAEYNAAVQQAPTDDAKAAVAVPDGKDVAPAIWQSVCGVTDSKQQEVQEKGGKKLITVRGYEFQKPWAAPAVIWLLSHPAAFDAAMGNAKPKQKAAFAKAVQRSFADTHYTTPAAADICAELATGNAVEDYDLLEKIYTRNRDNNARACAAMGMSIMLADPMLSSVAGSAAVARAKRLYYLKQSLLLAKPETQFGGHPLNDVATEQAYRIRHLSVGAVPPQIKLTDLQGKEQSFPQPGTLQLFLFWSPKDDTGTEIANYLPELQRRHPKLTVVPIAPYCEEDERAELSQLAHDFSVYLDSPEGTAGKDYRVFNVPYVVLLDAQCRILYIGFPDLRLQTALDNVNPYKPEEKKGTITISEKPAEPASEQPSAAKPAEEPTPQPAPAAEEEAPTLREMPQF